jgi:toxin-antitoxin system PIN domain toxin
MPIHLLDVNVLVALAWSNHVHHDVVTQWFAARGENGWATCPITQGGFVRISTNPIVLSSTLSPRQAIDALQQLTSHPAHQFWPDELPISDALSGLNVTGYRQITDAYLLGLARRHNGKLVTLDRAITAIGPDVEVLIG